MPAASRWRLTSMQPESATDLGAPAIEIGIELVAPRVDPSDLPVGPDTEAAAPSPAIVEQKTVIEHNDLPKAVPTETDDPDRVVAPNETKKPEEDAEIANRAGAAFDRVDCCGGDRDADAAKRAGSAAFGCSLARNRRERTARRE